MRNVYISILVQWRNQDFSKGEGQTNQISSVNIDNLYYIKKMLCSLIPEVKLKT